MAIEPSIVKPKPKPDEIEALAAAKTGQYGDKFGTGTGEPGSVPGGTPSGGCAPGSPSGTPTGENSTTGPTSGGGTLGGDYAGINPAVQDMLRKSIPEGCNANVTPKGGYDARPSRPGSAHPRGLAADTQLFCGGQLQTAGSPKLNQYIYNLNQNGARGLAFYTRPNQQFVHADLMGPNKRRWSTDGASQAYTDAAAGGQDPGPGAANAAAAQGGGGGGDPCYGDGGGSGCQPISSSAPQIAAGLSQNLGLDVSAGVQGLVGALTSGNPLAAAMGAVSSAVGNALGLGGALPLSPAALADPTAAITQLAADKIASMGASVLPSVVGNLDPVLVQASGIAQGLVSDKIQSSANQIFGKNSPPQLEKFISIFNAAQAAQNYANSLQYTIGHSLNNVFGNAGELFQDYTKNNWANVPGLANEDNPWLLLDGPTIGEVKTAVDLGVSRQNLIGNTELVLDRVVKQPSMNLFSTAFYDWDAYVTRGFGTITNNVIELGYDFIGLGKLADLNDMLRIGTAGQIAQQIIANGASVSIGLSNFMIENQLSIADLSDPINDPLIAEFLQSVIDPDAVDLVVEVLEIEPTLNLTSLGDLLDAQWILPRSYEYNYFEKINDISVFLSILFVNSTGQIRTLSDLGRLLVSFEVPFDTSKIEGDPALYDYKQITELANQYAPVGYFSSDGTLSIADFIGTAAGYVHEVTIPRIAEIQAELYNDTSYFDNYIDLVDLLSDTLSGVYTVLGIPPAANTVQPPSAGGYSFGIYNSLDDAVSDIVDAIETELDAAKAQIETDNDIYILELMRELDSLHTESSLQLAREHKLRNEYGLKLGTPKKTDRFIGDGSTNILPLTVDIDTNEDLDVYISGVWQAPSGYTVNATANTITLAAAPAFGTIVSVVYRTDAFDGKANKMQIWEFASNLENLARETGSGRAADFLRKVTTDDVYGQRIQAALMLSRNKARARAAGINSSNFETNDGVGPTYSSFIEWTGIWSENEERASELYVQINSEVDTYNEYLLQKLANNSEKILADSELLMNNVVRQLIFEQDNQIVISDLMVLLYNDMSQNPTQFDSTDLALRFNEDDLPSDGISLGSSLEIVSQIMKQEGLENTVYNLNLSQETNAYLKRINVDLAMLVSVCQLSMLATLARNFGITEQEARNIFGVQSLSKNLLTNMANGY